MKKITKFEDIPGWSFFHKKLSMIVDTFPDYSNILEIGSGVGKSTWAILDNIKPNSRLNIIDPFTDNDDRTQWNEFIRYYPDFYTEQDNTYYEELFLNNSQFEIFNLIIRQHENISCLNTIYQGKSIDYIKDKNQSTFDLVFLDGSHMYETVKAELEYFSESVVICGDDYGNDNQLHNVKKAVDEFVVVTGRKFEFDRECNFFMIYR